MSEPAWLVAIKDAYMADRASVFLLHGPGTRAQWTLDGVTDDFPDILVSFLARTREVVGLLAPPASLRFPGIGDTGRFERVLAAAFLVSGDHQVLNDDVIEQALAKLWIAMSDASTPQGYVLPGIDLAYPENRKRVIEIPGAPPLWDWATHPRIRAANHIVLLVVSDLALVRKELIEAAQVIRVNPPVYNQPEPEPEPDMGPEAWQVTVQEPDDEDAEQATAIPMPLPTPRPPSGNTDVDVAAVEDALNSAICANLATYGEEFRPAKVPVLAAVAQILGERTGSPGPLTWALDEDGNPIPTGEGADDFMATWRADIVFDASAGMVISKLPASSIPDRLEETGLRVLAKRLAKLL